MDLGLSTAETELQGAVRQFVEREARREVLVSLRGAPLGFRHEWLRVMADAGWLGLFVPSALGGSDATLLEAVVVYDELGRGPVPGPLISSSGVAALLISALGSERLKERYLIGVAEGKSYLAPVGVTRGKHPSPPERDTALSIEGAVGRRSLRGRVGFVLFAEGASDLLVMLPSATEDEPSFAIIPADSDGVRIKRLSGFLAASYEIEFSDVRIDESSVIGGEAGSSELVERALDTASVVISAYQVGGCRSLLEWCISYCDTRVQFGVPIGRFQRVQDHVVRLLNAMDAAQWVTYDAASKVDTEGFCPSTHLMKSVVSEAYYEAANAAHEVFAGVGSDPLFGLSLYTEMSRTLFGYLGTPLWHRRMMADKLAW